MKLAQLFNSEIIVLHVQRPYDSPGAILPGMEAGTMLPPSEPTPSEEDETTREAAERFGEAGSRVTRRTVLGDPAAEILAQCSALEIDLIALEDATLCFVEVRYRQSGTFGHPSATITRLKQSRIARTASYFLTNVWRGPSCACHFDVVTLIGADVPEIVLLRNAFEVPQGGAGY